jgi:hypothetical protein
MRTPNKSKSDKMLMRLSLNKLSNENQSQEALGSEGVKIENNNTKRIGYNTMTNSTETLNKTQDKPIRWDEQAIEDIKSSIEMLQDAGLTLENIAVKNPKLIDTFKRIESGEIVAKGSRAETLLNKFMKKNPEHALSKFVLEHGSNFDFDEEDAIIRINGAKKPKEEALKK